MGSCENIIDISKHPQIMKKQLLNVQAPQSKLTVQTFKNPYWRGAPFYFQGRLFLLSNCEKHIELQLLKKYKKKFLGRVGSHPP